MYCVRLAEAGRDRAAFLSPASWEALKFEHEGRGDEEGLLPRSRDFGESIK